MPNRLKKTVMAVSAAPGKFRLKGFREAVEQARGDRGWSYVGLARAMGKIMGKKSFDDDYLRRMLKGERFNEENIAVLAEVLGLPIYIGDVPIPKVTVEAAPGSGIPEHKGRPENIPIPVVSIATMIQKPFRYDPGKVEDWSIINRRAFQVFQLDKMACVKLSMETDAPLVRKDALVCICTGTMPPPKQVPSAPVWAAKKGDALVIGHYEEQEGAILLTRTVPSRKSEVIASREDIVGRVCWVWHSLV